MTRPAPNIAIDISIEHEAWTALADIETLVERCATSFFAEMDDAPRAAELSLMLCDDAFIRTLNKRWRGKDVPTNVLSFPAVAAIEPGTGSVMLGDIVIAYETSAGEAAIERLSLCDHLAHLVIHGLSHLLGFDHEEEGDADAMEALESRALARLGIASPYRIDEDMRAAP